MSEQMKCGFPGDLRDWFAGQVMAGMLNGCVGTIGGSKEPSAYAKGHCNSAIVDRAFVLADAMLSAHSAVSKAEEADKSFREAEAELLGAPMAAPKPPDPGVVERLIAAGNALTQCSAFDPNGSRYRHEWDRAVGAYRSAAPAPTKGGSHAE